MDKFSPPKVGIGDVALWFKNRGSAGVPFVVTNVDARTVAGVLFGSQVQVYGLHHTDDPETRRAGLLEEMETWDLTDALKRLSAVEAKLADAAECPAVEAPAPEPVAVESDRNPIEEAKRMIGDGIHDNERIRKATGLHHKQVDKLIRDWQKHLSDVRAAELVGSN